MCATGGLNPREQEPLPAAQLARDHELEVSEKAIAEVERGPGGSEIQRAQRSPIEAVRLLGRYVNSATEAKKIRDLSDRAASEHVERPHVEPRKTFSKLRPDQIDEILARYEARERTVDIARDFGIDAATIRHLRRRMQIPARRPGMSDAEIDKAAEPCESGLSLRQVTFKVGFSSNTIKKELTRRGLIRDARS